jgi:DNA repair protein RecN (Recombination protein N)
MSLQRISLRDFVIVRQLDLDFNQGFGVLSGETGAGKSILVDALQLVLGARADASVVREGASRTEISVEFALNPSLQSWLEDNGFEAHDDVLLKRSIDAQGKSRAWINGSAATATQLRDIGDSLVDIHGQHAWQSLTRPAAVRGLLDAYAGLDAQALNQLWTTWRQAQQTLANARLAQDHLQQERERLSWQIGEVDKLSPQANEWEELNAQHSRLSNAQSLMDAAQAALHSLQDDSSGATLSLVQAQNALLDQASIEPEFQALADQLASAWRRPRMWRTACKPGCAAPTSTPRPVRPRCTPEPVGVFGPPLQTHPRRVARAVRRMANRVATLGRCRRFGRP